MKTQINVGSRTSVSPAEVLYFKAESNYTQVYFISGESIWVSTNLKKIQDRFAECSYFFRPNRAFFINLKHAEFEPSISTIKIKGEEIILVSRRRKSCLLAAMSNNNV